MTTQIFPSYQGLFLLFEQIKRKILFHDHKGGLKIEHHPFGGWQLFLIEKDRVGQRPLGLFPP
jgi:hypothetical protein